MSDANASEAEKNIEIWKVKKLIRSLEAARGNGTSMISLIIRKLCSDSAHRNSLTKLVAPKDQVSRAAKMLAEEYVRRFPHSP
jgi:peptide chain release factor subunit 1